MTGFESQFRHFLDLGSDLPTLKVYFYLLATAPVFIISLAAYAFVLIFIVILVFLGIPGAGIFHNFLLFIKILTGIFAAIFVWKYFQGRSKILPLHKTGLRRKAKDRFGAKAYFLGRLRRNGVNIPDGYAFAAVGNTAADNTAFNKAIRRYARFISRKMAGENVIVRSSFRLEGQGNIAFPGVFQSIGPVRAVDVKAVEKALETVLKSRNDGFAKNLYGKDLGEDDSLSFVVQEFIETQVSGFGRSSDTLTGRPDCFLVEISQGDGTTLRFSRIFRRWQLVSGKYEALPENMLAEIAKLIERVSDLMNVPVEIEWGWKDGACCLFQARPLEDNTEIETWFIPDDMGLDYVLTPMSTSVFGDEKDFQTILAGIFGRLDLAEPEALIRLRDGGYYVSWREYQRINRRLRKRRPPFRSIIGLLKLLPASPKAVEFVYGQKRAPLAELTFGLAKEIELQQDHRMRADFIAALVEKISAGVIEAEDLPSIFPMGQRHPLLKIGREIHNAFASGDEESLVEKYGFLSRYDWEISKKRADQDPSILRDFRFAGPPEGESDDDGNWIEARSKLRANEKFALIKTRTLLCRFLGNVFRKESLKAEIRHLNILKINAEIRRSVMELGRQKGLCADEVFFLKLPELLEGAIDLKVVEDRKSEYEKLEANALKKVLYLKNGESVGLDAQSKREKTNDIWFGLGSGQGVMEGVMRLPSEITGEQSDSIIVIPDMKSHHLGILQRRRPFIALKGGILNHLASLAREIQIPFVVLETCDEEPPPPGMRVKIDFAKGMIERV